LHCHYNANVHIRTSSSRLFPKPSDRGPVSPAPPHEAASGTLSFALLGAAHALREVESGVSLSAALPALAAGWKMSAQDRGAVQAIAFHTLRQWGRMRALRQLLVPRLPKPTLLRIYLEVVLSCEQQSSPLAARGGSKNSHGAPTYPAHTLVDQAVGATHLHPDLAHASGLVNAVLRRWQREGAMLEDTVPRSPESLWNHPNWWVEKLAIAAPEHWREHLRLNASAAPMTLRVNRRKTTRGDYLNQLRVSGLAGDAIGDSGIVLEHACAVERLPGFTQGLVSVQDYGAQLAAELLDAQDGHEVLDACAAPGGKTAHLLELSDCRVTALDNDPDRLARVGDSLARLQLSDRARVVCADAALPTSWGAPMFDRILLDAPCSASGIVRRHPDIRWLRRASDIAQLALVQARLLDALWPHLKPGGRLLYCTCSVFTEEGAAQAQQFAARTSDARRLPLVINQPGVLEREGQLMPSITPAHDGFYYALFEKRAQ
jgi:16S rRNA (cytosine967-C5)-methyltransferase